ncbi:sterol desaturase family protein [Acidisphaera sp. L21]|uniref:sterol desaturase family protein n=1 Tax=Acidisphaera sp. L21 TaxID=1641851 RepID=UPI00131DFB6F|nr:sterol desaturase family protein [Acidisphaera sp. L21]
MFVVGLAASLPVVAVVAIIFTVLSVLPSCNAGRPWWRKPDLATDIGYLVVMPGLMYYARIALLMVGMLVLYGVTSQDAAWALLEHGCGPLSALPFAAQVAIYLVASEIWLYATHRWLHDLRLWRFHAVHHSSEHLEWLGSFRVHPVDFMLHFLMGDSLLLLLGISPGVLVWLVPFSIGMSTLTHANLNWDFGPFRTVLASPVFHRWHHTGVDRGGERNFASTFPIIDVIFGTYYMPKGELPSDYGVTERDVPYDFGGQLMHPFRAQASSPAAIPAHDTGD